MTPNDRVFWGSVALALLLPAAGCGGKAGVQGATTAPA